MSAPVLIEGEQPCSKCGAFRDSPAHDLCGEEDCPLKPGTTTNADGEVIPLVEGVSLERMFAAAGLDMRADEVQVAFQEDASAPGDAHGVAIKALTTRLEIVEQELRQYKFVVNFMIDLGDLTDQALAEYGKCQKSKDNLKAPPPS